MDTQPDSLSDGGDDAQGNEGGQDLPGAQAQGGEQRKGGKNRAGKNGNGARDGETAKGKEITLAEAVVNAIANFRSNKDLKRRVNPKFKAMKAKKLELYSVDGLDALHDLAMMPITPNPLLNQIKYMAASRLAGPAQEQQAPISEVDGTLRRLNEQFHRSAPRIKSVRERVITFDSPPEPRLINGE